MKQLILISLLLYATAAYAQSLKSDSLKSTFHFKESDSLIDASQRNNADLQFSEKDFNLPKSFPGTDQETIIILNEHQVITPKGLMQIKKEDITTIYVISDDKSKGKIKSVVMVSTK